MEQFSNAGGANLDGAITSSATTITIKIPVNVPSSGTFRALIDSEYLKVTAVSGLNWTVVRGDGGSTAASHIDNSGVDIIVTKEAIDALVTVEQDGTEVASRRVLNFVGPKTVTDNSGNSRIDIESQPTARGTTASLPSAAAANKSQLYLPSDGPIAQRSDGSAWKPHGPIFPLTAPPLAATWTWVNQNTSTASDTTAGLYLQTEKVASDNLKMLVRSTVATPYTYKAGLVGALCANNDSEIFLVVRDSSSSKLTVFGYKFDVTTRDLYLAVTTYNSPTSGVANVFFQRIIFFGPVVWLGVGDDGTNRTYLLSSDGVNYITIYSEGRTTFQTPNQVGFGVNPGLTFNAHATLISWAQT